MYVEGAECKRYTCVLKAGSLLDFGSALTAFSIVMVTCRNNAMLRRNLKKHVFLSIVIVILDTLFIYILL